MNSGLMQIKSKCQILTFIGYSNLPKLLQQFCEFFFMIVLDIDWQSRDDDALCDFTQLDPSFLNLVFYGMHSPFACSVQYWG